MKKALLILVLVCISGVSFAADKPRTPNYITPTYPTYKAPSSMDSSKDSSKKPCTPVVVQENNFFTKAPQQTVKCY